MENLNSGKSRSNDSNNQIEDNSFEKFNSKESSTVIFQLKLGKDLPATETAAKYYAGQFHRIKWNQILKMADAICALAANYLMIDESRITLEDIIGFGGSQAKVGRQGVIQENIEIELASNLNNAILHFMQKVTDIRGPGMDGDLLQQESLSQNEVELIDRISKEFLKRNGNSKITIPIEYHYGECKIICNGQFAKKPTVGPAAPIALIIHGNLDAIIKSTRMFVVKKGKERKNIHFDSEKHLLRLSKLLTSEEEFSFHVLEEKMGQGDAVFTLESIGNQDTNTLF